MANPHTTITGHLAHDLLHTLADLDGGQKLLGISALLKSARTTATEHVKHPVGLAAVLVSQCQTSRISSLVTTTQKHHIAVCAIRFCTELVVTLPDTISRALYVEDMGNLKSLQTIALINAMVLATTLSLRFLVLDAACATYIYSEIQQARLTGMAAGGRQVSARSTDSLRLELRTYYTTARTCFRGATLWFVLLHLQTVLMLAVVEILTASILHKMVF